MHADSDTPTIAICALRYAQGRRTYMPTLVIAWVKRHWERFPEVARERMLKDLEDAISIERGCPGHLGDECDVRAWQQFRGWMMEEGKMTDQAKPLQEPKP